MTVSAERRQAIHSTFTTPDGVEIAVQEWGNPEGSEIVFLHGYSQCHLSWAYQVESDALREFRLITYDLRGHGNSAKPHDPAAYAEGRRWANELQGVFEHKQLRRPVVVAWSYSGRVISDYLELYGIERFAGLNLVATKTRSDPAFVGPENAFHQSRMMSEDLSENIAGTIGFLRTCAEHWDEADFERQLAFNMIVPAYVRTFLRGRGFDVDHIYSRASTPVLLTHGTLDKVVDIAASHAGHAIMPHSTLSIYDGVGHSPFVEDHKRFNRELADFVKSACR